MPRFMSLTPFSSNRHHLSYNDCLAVRGEITIDPTCIDHCTWTVSEWTKDNTVSFGLRDMTRRFRDCL